jgi:hypothetical protein
MTRVVDVTQTNTLLNRSSNLTIYTTQANLGMDDFPDPPFGEPHAQVQT